MGRHQQLENYNEAERLLKEKLNSPRINPKLYVELGYNYALQKKDSLATINYEKAIETIGEQINYARNIGETFEKLV